MLLHISLAPRAPQQHHPFTLQTPPSPPPPLLFCLKFNKGWKSGVLKRTSGVFWHGFKSHAGAMWTRWHGRVLGTGGQWERGQWGKKERTKEGKFWTRGTRKQRELQKNEVVAETNLCSNRMPVKWAVQTEQHVNEKTDWKAKVRVMGRVSKVTSWCARWKLVCPPKRPEWTTD